MKTFRVGAYALVGFVSGLPSLPVDVAKTVEKGELVYGAYPELHLERAAAVADFEALAALDLPDFENVGIMQVETVHHYQETYRPGGEIPEDGDLVGARVASAIFHDATRQAIMEKIAGDDTLMAEFTAIKKKLGKKV